MRKFEFFEQSLRLARKGWDVASCRTLTCENSGAKTFSSLI